MGADPKFQPSAFREHVSSQQDCRNVGVLQTTVAEIVTVKEHQRELNARVSASNTNVV